MNSKLGAMKEPPLKTVQTYKEITFNQLHQQLRQDDANKDRGAVQDSKNIKTMMSYYKNKRLIKNISKMNDYVNLTNTEIQESINLRVVNANSIKKALG